MKLFVSFLAQFLIFSVSYAQFSTELLAPLPEAITNNAVCGAQINGQKFIYSFGGMDTTKSYSGIHNRSYKLNVTTNTWISLPNLPSPITKIAAGASCIDSIIYIIGGYQVLSNGNEISHTSVHRFSMLGDTFLVDGSPLPKATDDHVQAVYQDSLIYVITGWSQNTNIPNVQIYNPTLDIWLTGTPVPNNHLYKSFGASGSILEDTIYYFGGAQYGTNFPIQRTLRKGWINPSKVTDIKWSIDTLNYDIVGYRMASTVFQNELLWIGGANQTYNYDGISYQGATPVIPNHRILRYSPYSNHWDTSFYTHINMDFRGIAPFETELFLVGGMEQYQQVSTKTLRLTPLTNTIANSQYDLISIYPNPTKGMLKITGAKGLSQIQIFNLRGQMVLSKEFNTTTNLNLTQMAPGIYFIKVVTAGSHSSHRLIITP